VVFSRCWRRASASAPRSRRPPRPRRIRTRRASAFRRPRAGGRNSPASASRSSARPRPPSAARSGAAGADRSRGPRWPPFHRPLGADLEGIEPPGGLSRTRPCLEGAVPGEVHGAPPACRRRPCVGQGNVDVLPAIGYGSAGRRARRRFVDNRSTNEKVLPRLRRPPDGVGAPASRPAVARGRDHRASSEGTEHPHRDDDRHGSHGNATARETLRTLRSAPRGDVLVDGPVGS
jgi:hypothetical protein